MRLLNPAPFLYVLLGISAAAWLVIASFSGLNLAQLGDFIKPIPQVVTVDLVVVLWFLRWGWRLRFLPRWLVPYPDLNGTWVGEIQTNWKDEYGNTPGPIPAMLTIRQSFGRLSCVMWTGEMRSDSFTEGFSLDPDRQIRQICYSYSSRPDSALRERSTPHDGTARLSIIGIPPTKLQGEYWTQRQTTGTINVSFKTRDILEELPDELTAHPMMKLNTPKLQPAVAFSDDRPVAIVEETPIAESVLKNEPTS